MSDADIERLATAVAAKLAAGHQCRFTGEEAGELHALAKTWARVKDYAINAIIGTLVLALLTVAWIGAKVSVGK